VSELKQVVWLGFVVPTIRGAVRPTASRAVRVTASLRRAAEALELNLERRLMDPAPPKFYGRTTP
jgi:hypothetical protein